MLNEKQNLPILNKSKKTVSYLLDLQYNKRYHCKSNVYKTYSTNTCRHFVIVTENVASATAMSGCLCNTDTNDEPKIE